MPNWEFTKGLTVKELRELIKDWPEEQEDDSEVWISTGETLSSPVVKVWTLNRSDLLLEPAGLEDA